jgi:hypothetical protein
MRERPLAFVASGQFGRSNKTLDLVNWLPSLIGSDHHFMKANFLLTRVPWRDSRPNAGRWS